MKNSPIRKTDSANKLKRELTEKPNTRSAISQLISFEEWIATGAKYGLILLNKNNTMEKIE